MKSWYTGFLIGATLGALGTLAGIYLLSATSLNETRLATHTHTPRHLQPVFQPHNSIDLWNLLAAWQHY